MSKNLFIPGVSKRLASIDGIRGIAIILVMAFHFGLYGNGLELATFIDRQVSRIILTGWIGVDLFFVLSGFLITGILYDTKHSRGYFRNFYMRRFLRIFPLYYGFLIVFFILLPRIDPEGAGILSGFNQKVWYWTYLINWKIGFAGWPKYLAISHFWSLGVEEQFYLIWPAIVLCFRHRNLMQICSLFVVGSFLFRYFLAQHGYDLVYVLLPARLDALAVGGFLALAFRSQNGIVWLSRWTWPVLIASASALLGLFIWKRGLEVEDFQVLTIGLSLIAIFFGAMVSLTVLSPQQIGLGKFFSSRILGLFGRYSYALYVFHHLASIYLPRFGISISSFPKIMGSTLPGYIAFSIVATLVSLALALISWYGLESRFLALKRSFEYRTTGDKSDENQRLDTPALAGLKE
jgi:peptidoglycan/LPS O-acetylase OafA/YrhL